MNKEINCVYEENGVNLFVGCGLVLLMFFVFVGLYCVFNNVGIDGAFDEVWFFLFFFVGFMDV